MRSYLATAVAADSGEILGGLFFGHAEPRVIDKVHAGLIESIGGQAAVAISRSRLFAEAQAAREHAEHEARENQRRYQAAQQANEMKDQLLDDATHRAG